MKKWLVGLKVGVLMGMPDFTLEHLEVVPGDDHNEAKEIYDKKHNCFYFYGYTIGEVEDVDLGIVRLRLPLEDNVAIDKEELEKMGLTIVN